MTPSKAPIAGTVIRFSYLWKRQQAAGQAEPDKDRPAVIVVRSDKRGRCIVVPVTHAPPYDETCAIELPEAERSRLGLDNERSWVMLDEVNAFVWPGSYVQAVPKLLPPTPIYGAVTKPFFAELLRRLQVLVKARSFGPVLRE